MTEPVRYESDGPVAVLSIDHPPVNALNHEVRAGLWAAIERAEADEEIGAVLIRAEGRTFPAGADIREFGTPLKAPILSDLFTRIEACAKPVLAVLHGHALGGGFELALACHYRIADATTKIGLPEINLGLLPGAGGTQRLPRITGAAPALDLILSGRQMIAAEAKTLGLVDGVVEEGRDIVARELARELAEEGRGPRPTRDRHEGFADPGAYLDAVRARRAALADAPIPAPLLAVDCVEAALLLPFETGLRRERAAFLDCVASEGGQALRHVFMAERRAAKIPERAAGRARKLDRLGVVGGGTMGTGIAISCLDAGFPVTLVEREAEALGKAITRIGQSYAHGVEKGRLTAAQRSERLARLHGEVSVAALGACDLVIEAVYEDAEVKHEVFAALDGAMKPGAILASNTSYLDLDALAATTGRAGDVVGYHFFSPAHVMKLLEVVVGRETTPDVVVTGFDLAKRLGKIAVRAGVSDGFIANRLLAAYRQAADFMLEGGASPAEIDIAMRDYGFPMGPYQVLDLAGLDISWARRKRLAPGRDPQARYVAIGDLLCERGWFGQKSGRGYYRYDGGEPAGREDPEVLSLIAAERERKGLRARRYSREEIQRRCLAAMANEGAKLLDEGVALRPSDIDVVMIHGYRFPRWRGGPMKAADLYGLLTLENELRAFAPEAPEFWTPAPLFDKLVKTGANFDSLNRA